MAKLSPQKTVEANYRRVLPKLLRKYFRRGNWLAKSRPGFPELHQFRIRTKRIRYIAELYEPLFPRELTPAVKTFKEIQQVLGALQDQSMIVAYFERRLVNVRAAGRQADYSRVLHRARTRQKQFRQQFLRTWSRLRKRRFDKRLITRIRG